MMQMKLINILIIKFLSLNYNMNLQKPIKEEVEKKLKIEKNLLNVKLSYKDNERSTIVPKQSFYISNKKEK